MQTIISMQIRCLIEHDLRVVRVEACGVLANSWAAFITAYYINDISV